MQNSLLLGLRRKDVDLSFSDRLWHKNAKNARQEDEWGCLTFIFDIWIYSYHCDNAIARHWNNYEIEDIRN